MYFAKIEGTKQLATPVMRLQCCPSGASGYAEGLKNETDSSHHHGFSHDHGESVLLTTSTTLRLLDEAPCVAPAPLQPNYAFVMLQKACCVPERARGTSSAVTSTMVHPKRTS